MKLAQTMRVLFEHINVILDGKKDYIVLCRVTYETLASYVICC